MDLGGLGAVLSLHNLVMKNGFVVEVVGIPSSIKHDRLEPTVCKILHHIGVNISGNKIEAFHRLGKNSDKTIVKCSSRKDCEHKMRVKNDLKDLNATDPDLSVGAKLYIMTVLVLNIEDGRMKPRDCGTIYCLCYSWDKDAREESI